MCILCFDTSGELIQLHSDEAIRCLIPTIVNKYFGILLMDQPLHGDICRKCWCRIDLFETFYRNIEDLHASVVCHEPMIVDTLSVIVDDVKDEIEPHQYDDVFQDCSGFFDGKCPFVKPLSLTNARANGNEIGVLILLFYQQATTRLNRKTQTPKIL